MAEPAAAHLQRDAYIYVRQSTLAQTVRNTESLLRQYDLAGRARQLGWADHQIVVVDDDLGRSGASAQGRKGFSDLVADVGLGKAGIGSAANKASVTAGPSPPPDDGLRPP